MAFLSVASGTAPRQQARQGSGDGGASCGCRAHHSGKIADGLPVVKTFAEEMLDFEAKMSASGHDSYHAGPTEPTPFAHTICARL